MPADTSPSNLQHQSQQLAKRMTHLLAVTSALATATTPHDVAAAVLQRGLDALDAQAGSFLVLDLEQQALVVVEAIGYESTQVKDWSAIPMTAVTPFTDAARSGQAYWSESRDHYRQDYPHMTAVPSYQQYGARASIPLMVNDRVLGVLALNYVDEHPISQEDRAFAQALAQQSAQVFDRARLYVAAQQALTQAEAAIRQRDEFLSIASHELNTPLTTLLGYSSLLLQRLGQRPDLEERDRRALQAITRQSDRLSNLVSEMLDISRIQHGQLALTRVRCDFAAIVGNIVEETQVTLTQHSIIYQPPPAPMMMFGDYSRLEQVVQNLLQNAVKYSPAGGTMTIRLEQVHQQAQLSVQDQGIGIPATDLPYVFQRFFRANNVESVHASGMGVGLYVVREIVVSHGGTIHVDSVEGQGSTFVVSLPLATYA